MRIAITRIVMLAAVAFLCLAAVNYAFAVPQNPKAHALIVKAFEEIKKGDCNAAEKHLDQAYKLDPRDPYVLLNLAVIYGNDGRTEKAKALLKKVVDGNYKEVPDRVHYQDDKGLTLSQIAQKNLDDLSAAGSCSLRGCCPVLPDKRKDK